MAPQLAEMVATGQVRWEIRHFPLQPQSVWGVEAVECAGDQGYWWAMHEHIMANQAKGISTKFTKDYATELGLDTAKFAQCVDSDQYVDFAKAEKAAGQKLNVEGTPTFFINGQPFQVQRSWDEVVQAVKKELNK